MVSQIVDSTGIQRLLALIHQVDWTSWYFFILLLLIDVNSAFHRLVRLKIGLSTSESLLKTDRSTLLAAAQPCFAYGSIDYDSWLFITKGVLL